MSERTVYLDNAATSFPKPPQVIKAVAHAMSHYGNPGRGGHKLAMDAAEEIFACRKAAARMFGASPERVIFTSGATHSLNIAINSQKIKDGALLISDLEHNSVLRPTIAAKKEVRVFSSCLSLDGFDRTAAILDSVDRLSAGACAVITTAASNICGARMPIGDIGAFCRERGLTFIVDGAQAGGIYDIDMRRDCIDVLCLPGHKGLYGPMGCGLLILGDETELEPFMYGGSGVDSVAVTMPRLPPERYEAGTLPLPLIAGLRRGIEFVERKGIETTRRHETMLAERLTGMLTSVGIGVYCPSHIGSTVLFNIEGMSSEEAAAHLSAQGICTRAGLHCAPLAHRTLGSEGAVRASLGVFNTEKDILKLVSAARGLQSTAKTTKGCHA